MFPREIRELEAYGVVKVFSPEDGRNLGLQGIINHMMKACDFPTVEQESWEREAAEKGDHRAIARLITLAGRMFWRSQMETLPGSSHSLTQEKEGFRIQSACGRSHRYWGSREKLIDRRIWSGGLWPDFQDKKIAILSVDPSKQKTGEGLLGDRGPNESRAPSSGFTCEAWPPGKTGRNYAAPIKEAFKS